MATPIDTASSPRRRRFRSIVLWLCVCLAGSAQARMEVWLTDPDAAVLFQPQTNAPAFVPGADSNPAAAATNSNPVITVNDAQSYQSIDGFGCCLTGGSAIHLLQMDSASRAALLRELFAADGANIGLSYLRVTIGASDLNDRVFSYDDLPAGETDPGLKHFSLGPDQADVIPALREILAINPEIKILGSPWSPPPWMKSTGDTRGGSLKTEFYDAYATYFVKYIEAMKAVGIRIDAVTVQNEPLNPQNNPSLLMLAPEQAEFIKHHLGPAFAAAHLDTKIILFDHNCDRPDYPLSILNDPEAAKYVDGSAFHLYAGKIEVLSDVQRAHPDKNLYFTELWTGASSPLKGTLDYHVKHLIIGATRNWSRNVLEWNLAADSQYQPHTDRGGCDRCLGAVSIDGNVVHRNVAYYILAHAAKFVRPGSVRIGSSDLPSLSNVAFKTPEHKMVLIVLNSSQISRKFEIRFRDEQAALTLNGGAVATCVWQTPGAARE
ncbi:MAG: glycoside hydrolase family 30 beta sandwich domain-containing protein [Verrucomicrobiota bacterium]|jgi:glucosylceramidase